MKKTHSLKELEIPINIVERDGPFDEFKQNVSFVTIILNDGNKVGGVLLMYPNHVIAIDGETELTFFPSKVTKIIQTEKDLKKRSASNWSFFYSIE